jgi:rod shape-determining protein MreB
VPKAAATLSPSAAHQGSRKEAMTDKQTKGAETQKKDHAAKDHGVLYLGIDLGTSRTSVAASNGQRESVASYVGYPKDVVSRKLLQKDVLFGDEALAHRLSLDLHRPLGAGVIQCKAGDTPESSASLKAARDLLNEIVRRAKPRKDELVYAVIGVPAQASIHNKDAILKAARESVDSVMLCSEPFSVAYGQDLLDDVLVIDIGAGTTDLCRMHGTMPEDADQLTNTFAGDHVDEELSKLVKKKHPEAQFTVQMIKAIKEKHSSVLDRMEPVEVLLPVNGKPTAFDLTNEVRSACRTLIPPIVDGLAKLIGSFDPEFQDRLKNRVLLAGGGSQIKGLDTAIKALMHERLGGGRVLRIEEPVYGGANGALKIAHDMPGEFWEKLR